MKILQEKGPVERNAKIIAARESGQTYRQIGVDFGISTARARQIFELASRRVRIAESRAKREADAEGIWTVGGTLKL